MSLMVGGGAVNGGMGHSRAVGVIMQPQSLCGLIELVL